jgi:hypothetical protein
MKASDHESARRRDARFPRIRGLSPPRAGDACVEMDAGAWRARRRYCPCSSRAQCAVSAAVPGKATNMVAGRSSCCCSGRWEAGRASTTKPASLERSSQRSSCTRNAPDATREAVAGASAFVHHARPTTSRLPSPSKSRPGVSHSIWNSSPGGCASRTVIFQRAGEAASVGGLSLRRRSSVPPVSRSWVQ